ncbi:MAG TPA: hypothetical protein VF329_09610 [Gammaproteobacteria bacterium]
MIRPAAVGLLAALGAAALPAQEPAPGPDVDLLEYLGSWGAGEDEELWRIAESENERAHREAPPKDDAKSPERARKDDDESN